MCLNVGRTAPLLITDTLAEALSTTKTSSIRLAVSSPLRYTGAMRPEGKIEQSAGLSPEILDASYSWFIHACGLKIPNGGLPVQERGPRWWAKSPF